MREALLYERLPGGGVRCHVCQWRCRIQPGGLGACKARQNIDGRLYALNYEDVTAAHVDPIDHLLRHIPSTPLSTLDRTYDIGKRAGLHFVYVGNVLGTGKENTVCPACGRLAIQRIGFETDTVGMKNGCCSHCKAHLNIRGRWSRCAPSSTDA